MKDDRVDQQIDCNEVDKSSELLQPEVQKKGKSLMQNSMKKLMIKTNFLEEQLSSLLNVVSTFKNEEAQLKEVLFLINCHLIFCRKLKIKKIRSKLFNLLWNNMKKK